MENKINENIQKGKTSQASEGSRTPVSRHFRLELCEFSFVLFGWVYSVQRDLF